jgi:hypothetical protein
MEKQNRIRDKRHGSAAANAKTNSFSLGSGMIGFGSRLKLSERSSFETSSKAKDLISDWDLDP